MVKYNNSPIIEAVCEFQFGKDTDWDMTIPGVMYGEIKNTFPHKEQHARLDINLPKDASGNAQLNNANLARFLSEDKKQLIQVGQRTLSINRLKPYVAWSEFKSLIDEAFNILDQKVALNSIQRIGLRYINRIEILQKPVMLENYFKFRPFFGEELQRDYSGFIVGCMFPFFGERDSCKVELTNAVPENNGASAFVLDIDYSMLKPQGIAVAQSLEWVEKAHEEVEKIFEGCISTPLRDLFGEVK
jgi:uncharacterized protein (TIGR04255 family)